MAGDCQLQKLLPSLCSLDMVVCGQGGQHSPRSKSVHSELAFEMLTQLGEANQTMWDGVIFWVSGYWLKRLLKQLREKVATTPLTNRRPDLGHGF